MLDRLMFWKDDNADEYGGEYEVAGCFTAPEEATVDTDPPSIADGQCAPPIDAIGDRRQEQSTD